MSIQPLSPSPPVSTTRDQRLMEKARDLETAFLAEMLQYTGLGAGGTEGFDGGAGEAQFGSFLREAQARQMVEKGGIGLAEHLFHSLARMSDGTK